MEKAINYCRVLPIAGERIPHFILRLSSLQKSAPKGVIYYGLIKDSEGEVLLSGDSLPEMDNMDEILEVKNYYEMMEDIWEEGCRYKPIPSKSGDIYDIMDEEWRKVHANANRSSSGLRKILDAVNQNKDFYLIVQGVELLSDELRQCGSPETLHSLFKEKLKNKEKLERIWNYQWENGDKNTIPQEIIDGKKIKEKRAAKKVSKTKTSTKDKVNDRSKDKNKGKTKTESEIDEK